VKAQNILARACGAVLILSLPFFLALTSILPLISRPFLRLQYARPDVPASTKFSPQQRLALAEAAFYYPFSNEDIDYLGDLKGVDGLPVFNERELAHMVDVQVFAHRGLVLDLLLGVLVAASLGTLASLPQLRARLPGYLFAASLVAPGLAVAALVVVPLQFRWFMVAFHQLFFVGDTWLFPRTDTLIQLFPEQFWFAGVQTWLLLVVAESVALAVASYLWMRRRRAVAP
jgi:integral membrane protein (TIGR01906 family)